MKQPFLVGEIIYLRTIESSDLNEHYQQWFNDEEVCQFNSHHRFPSYLDNLNEYYTAVIKTKNNLVLAIVDKANDTHLGNIALQNINYIDRSAELAIIIGEKEYWKKGVGVEACRLIIAHGFKALNLHRIYCGTSQANSGMQKLAQKLGFKEEGVQREALYKNGKYEDTVQYGLLAYDYKE